MFTSEFDRLDHMLNVAKIEHDMRYGKSEIEGTNRLFYILPIANRLEVRLLDNERHSLEEGGLELQAYGDSPKNIKRKLDANSAMSEVLKRLYYLGEKDDNG